MIAVLLMFLFFAVLQVAVFFYVRNLVAAAAADGSRYAAAQDVPPGAGGAYADQAIGRRLSADAAASLPCAGVATNDPASGLALASVHCTGRIKSFFFPLGSLLTIDVTSRSLKEGVP